MNNLYIAEEAYEHSADQQIDIRDSVLRYCNYFHLGKEVWAKKRLRMYISKIFKNCNRCTEKICESSCPRNLLVSELIAKITEHLYRTETNIKFEI